MTNGKVDWRRKMDEAIAGFESGGLTGDRAPTLLLHSCCGPCSTAVIETLAAHFKVTVFYYNPNIDEREEYELRAREQRRVIELLATAHPVSFVEGEYEPELFLEKTRNRMEDPEGGIRCSICYALRLDRTAKEAALRGFQWFTSTLSVSPMKDALRLNRIGEAAARKYGVRWLPSDFKKKNGYLRSIELAKSFGLYRQDYCGCSFSREAEIARREANHKTAE